MDPLLSLFIGIGLSAACGFRVFVPLLVMSVAAHTGHLTLVKNFQWIGSDIALAAFAIATALEVAAYYIPWLDHLLDTIATPAAIIAGTIVTAAMVGNVSPFLKWTLAVIAGGGAAGLVQTTTVLTRAGSTALTGGLGNPVFATIELGGSFLTSVLSLFVPVVVLVLLFGFAVVVWKKVIPRVSKRKFFQ